MRIGSQVVRQWLANPLSSVRFRAGPFCLEKRLRSFRNEVQKTKEEVPESIKRIAEKEFGWKFY
jgi:hypothetical protein